jgi:intein/homing endonuclease
MNNQKMNCKILVTVKDLEGIYYSKNTSKWIDIAVKRKIVPLRPSSKLAQLCGHLIGDGCLRIVPMAGGQIKFFGQIQKLMKINKIYKKLFNKKMSLVERERKNDEGYRLETTDSIVVRCLNRIGVPSGDKVLIDFDIPCWIRNGNKEVKRGFLQALFDDELECLSRDKQRPNSWKGLRLRRNKSEKLLQSGLKFFNQIILLLDDFSIKTTEAKVYNTVSYIRGDGTKTYRLVFRIKNDVDNRRKFLKEIGFIYDKKKQKSLIKSLA